MLRRLLMLVLSIGLCLAALPPAIRAQDPQDPSDWVILFEESFENNDNQWRTVSDGATTAGISDGVFRIEADANNLDQNGWITTPFFDDNSLRLEGAYTLEFDFRADFGDQSGCLNVIADLLITSASFDHRGQASCITIGGFVDPGIDGSGTKWQHARLEAGEFSFELYIDDIYSAGGVLRAFGGGAFGFGLRRPYEVSKDVVYTKPLVLEVDNLVVRQQPPLCSVRKTPVVPNPDLADEIEHYWSINKDLNQVLTDFDAYLTDHPEDVMALAYRGATYRLLGETDAAAADFETILSLDPTNALAFAFRARLSLAAGDFDQAIQDAEQSIALDPESTLGYFTLGRIYYDTEDFDLMLEQFEKALTCDDGTVAFYSRNLYYLAGEGYRLTEDFETALDYYNQSLEIFPDDTQTLSGRAVVYRFTGETALALDDLNRVLAMSPDYVFALSHRAEIYLEQGECELGKADLDAVVAIDSSYTDYRDEMVSRSICGGGTRSIPQGVMQFFEGEYPAALCGGGDSMTFEAVAGDTFSMILGCDISFDSIYPGSCYAILGGPTGTIDSLGYNDAELEVELSESGTYTISAGVDSGGDPIGACIDSGFSVGYILN